MDITISMWFLHILKAISTTQNKCGIAFFILSKIKSAQMKTPYAKD